MMQLASGWSKRGAADIRLPNARSLRHGADVRPQHPWHPPCDTLVVPQEFDRQLVHAELLTDKQVTRLTALFADDRHVEVEATWGIYQQMLAGYRHEDRRHGRDLMTKLIESVSTGVPKALTEVITLGRTLKKRAAHVLAYFDRPGTSNGPTEAINGRLEHLRGSALRFRNVTNYIARSLLETGGFRPQLHRPQG